MSYYVLSTYAMYAATALSIACSVIANAKVHPAAKHPFRVLLWRDRSDFSGTGWQFRLASVYLGAAAFALVPVSKMIQFFQSH
ncbi:hypothetical protein ASD15_03485 [Massilia sp. Root351]|uniref:hypothetical protein n=1 Tax=Massilia sp. Root351 TaxID=1736522 RepID=UPI00070B1CBE|nr:hypothetical protein [Massilia sp. Root351]KQV91126.1 hypothetical protein ASD15_03485 [Massilia sp. Root351]